MNFNWSNPKLAVADSDLGKGQFATQDIEGGSYLRCLAGA